MSLRLSGWDDTIVALATPPGVGALGVIRLSGTNAIDLINELFPSKNLAAQSSHTLHVGYLKANDEILDQVVVSLYKAPHSYTGEDVAEISCHGSPFVLQRVLEVCTQQGARIAKPGEFTQRAFLAGKLDLAQAEAVGDLIAANTTASQKTALNNIRGRFSQALRDLREQLVKFAALIELELDFSQEDVEFADRTQLTNLVTTALEQTRHLLDSYRLGNVIKNGVSVAIIGRPNAGKSTLLNSLLNEDRAIVSDIPGTTRDTIEELLNIDGLLFRLIDTAGIRSHTADAIEAAGIEKSREKIRQADLVLLLVDANETTVDDLQQQVSELGGQATNYLLVANKTDLVNEDDIRKKFAEVDNMIFISAKTGLHTDTLKQHMVNAVLRDSVQGEDVIVTNTRHYHALQEAYNSLTDVAQGIHNHIPGDLLALDLRRSLHHLGTITGEITNNDLLDYVFSKFCIGK